MPAAISRSICLLALAEGRLYPFLIALRYRTVRPVALANSASGTGRNRGLTDEMEPREPRVLIRCTGANVARGSWTI